MLFLRFAPMTPASQGLCLMVLSGAVLAAWADPSEKAFGEALSVWSRIVRIKALWFRFFPDPATMRWLATGAKRYSLDAAADCGNKAEMTRDSTRAWSPAGVISAIAPRSVQWPIRPLPRQAAKRQPEQPLRDHQESLK